MGRIIGMERQKANKNYKSLQKESRCIFFISKTWDDWRKNRVKRKTGATIGTWTRDLFITNEVLYHWAMAAKNLEKLRISSL
jgi:hypothetical protein